MHPYGGDPRVVADSRDLTLLQSQPMPAIYTQPAAATLLSSSFLNLTGITVLLRRTFAPAKVIPRLIAGLDLLAKEAGGLGIVVIARTGLVPGAEVEVDGRVEIVLGVEIEPAQSGVAGVLLGSQHESVGQPQSTKRRAHVKALDLGGMGELRQRAKHDASRRSSIDDGDPDGRVRTGEIVFEGGTVIAHQHSDSFVIFLDESEHGIGQGGCDAMDGDGANGIRRHNSLVVAAAEELFHFAQVGGARVGGEALHKHFSVLFFEDAVVEQDEQAAIVERADEASETLLEGNNG